MKRTTAALLAALVVSADLTHSAAAITRGEVADMTAATEVIRCANGYIGRGSGGDKHTELWRMCLHAVAELAYRDKIDVARRVIKKQGYNVFEIEEDPGWFGNSEPKELTAEMIARIHRGE